MSFRAFTIGAGLVAAAVIIACGSESGSDFESGPDGDGGFGTSGGSSGTALPPFSDGGATQPEPGVLLIHAALFPPFRVCFESYSKLAAQPDHKLMPEANVVGVDVGSFVRLGAMKQAPGKVYIIPQRKIPHSPDDPSDPSCAQYIAEHQDTRGADYLEAGEIKVPVGASSAQAIVISGCGNSNQVSNLGFTNPGDECAYTQANDGASYGTLKATVIDLDATSATTQKVWPVELYNASDKLVELTPAGSKIDVTFGDLSQPGALSQSVGSNFELLQRNPTVMLDFVQKDPAVYGTYGFRIAYRSADGDAGDVDAGGFQVDETLAVVQGFSLPSGTPTTYFAAPSNYALVLLGDPRVQPRIIDGGVDPTYDPRRSVHLVAIPVRDGIDTPALGESADAGNDPGDASTDAGPR